MATNATWTVVFEDQTVIKQTGDAAKTGYIINDDVFWNQSKFSNIWAIQYGTSNTSDEVEYRDGTPHSAYDSSVLGDINDFITRWDSAHLAKLQSDWDNDNLVNDDGTPAETEAEKISRLGARPTSYSS
jgi:hypothetical protein